MAKGAARDAKQKTQKITLDLPTNTFITLGEILDPEFSVSKEDLEVKRAKGTVTIHPIEIDTSLIEKWIVDVVKVEADKAYVQKQKELEALMDSMKEQLIASGWTPPKDEETKATKKK